MKMCYLVCLDAWTLAAAAACREPALAVRLPRYCLRPRCPIPAHQIQLLTPPKHSTYSNGTLKLVLNRNHSSTDRPQHLAKF